MAKSAHPPKVDDDVDFSVPLAKAQDPLVLALDVGSTASRGSLHDAQGIPVRGYRHKVPHSFTTGNDGTSIIDPDQVVEELGAIIDTVIGSRKELIGRVKGVAIDTFASSLVGVDANRHATSPCYTYADSRCTPQLAQLRAEVDEYELQQLTGARLHTSYLAPRLRWLREEEPEIFAATKRWISLGEYFHIRLLGKARAGTAVAAWSGLQDRSTGNWSERMLELAGIDLSHLSLIARPTQPILEVPSGITQRWPALKDAKWFAPIADGLAQNVGAGGRDASTVVVSMSTSGAMRVMLHSAPEEIPSGLWCYRVDDNRHLLGGAINDVGRAIDWAGHTFALPEGTELADVATQPYSPNTPLFLPYLTGERSTGWVGGAQAHALGITASTEPQDLVRGVMEGIVVSLGRVATQLKETAGHVDRLVTTGGVSQNIPGIQQLLADHLGRETIQATFKRSTLRGTAVMALEVLAPQTQPAEAPRSQTFKPKGKHREHWEQLAQRYQDGYSQLISA
ncbi:gluconokinase [Kocuria sp.]|uniref:gluconokinase n=1 Tax=Kocuria sp. TaxID=1871328 RepID=UPI0026DEF144|nr:gluconokinase [Kocuria sp.]MDO5619771.1 gluconokinase [Kocuria sp.]